MVLGEDFSHTDINQLITALKQFDASYYRDDGRMPISQIYNALYNELVVKKNWSVDLIATQRLNRAGGEVIFPILGWRNYDNGEEGVYADKVIIVGIHGTEPAPVVASADMAGEIDSLSEGSRVLIIFANPWGYAQNRRYGTSGLSVGDCDKDNVKVANNPASPEAEKISEYLRRLCGSNTLALDCHEDNPEDDEEEDDFHPNHYFDSDGTYMYITGSKANIDSHSLTQEIRNILVNSGVPLIMTGKTRFGEQIQDGIVVNTKDGSIDQFMAEELGMPWVITPEILTTISLADRVGIYKKIIRLFLEYN